MTGPRVAEPRARGAGPATPKWDCAQNRGVRELLCAPRGKGRDEIPALR